MKYGVPWAARTSTSALMVIDVRPASRLSGSFT
jgi:hypothetical protein